MTQLPGVRANLLSNPLDDQVLVYDCRGDTVHLLDPTTARVMELLQTRRWTVDELTAELAGKADLSSSAALLELALEELRKADLLDDSIASQIPRVDLTRREVLRKMMLAGAAAVLIPAIVTLSPSTAYAQTSCLPKHACCTVDAQCCSATCKIKGGSACPGTLECG
jgi:PqqD family protein of HPr-rel-A system